MTDLSHIYLDSPNLSNHLTSWNEIQDKSIVFLEKYDLANY